MSDKEPGKTPLLRFQAYAEAWKRRKYSDTFVHLSNNSFSRAELNYESGQARNIHYGDVLIKYGEILDVKKERIPYITNTVLVEKIKASGLREGDVVIADAAEDESVGKCTEVVNVGREIVVSGLHTIPSRPTVTFASGYLGYYMNSIAYHNQLLKLIQGTKVSSISKTALQDTVINYPAKSEEQSKISKLFQILDRLISLLQRELDLLEQQKQTLLSKMFTREGELVPEIRFNGFTGDWEQHKLGLLAEFSKGSGYSKNDLTKQGTPIILYGRLYTKYEIVINDIDTFVESRKKSVLSEGNEVLVPASGETAKDISRAAVVGKSGILLGGDLNIVKPNQKINPYFLAIAMSNGMQQKEMSKRAQGKSVVHLHNSDLEEVNLCYPVVKEQQNIAKLFLELDNTVVFHQRKLEIIKEMKKTLLKKMLI